MFANININYFKGKLIWVFICMIGPIFFVIQVRILVIVFVFCNDFTILLSIYSKNFWGSDSGQGSPVPVRGGDGGKKKKSPSRIGAGTRTEKTFGDRGRGHQPLASPRPIAIPMSMGLSKEVSSSKLSSVP